MFGVTRIPDSDLPMLHRSCYYGSMGVKKYLIVQTGVGSIILENIVGLSLRERDTKCGWLVANSRGHYDSLGDMEARAAYDDR
jgi:hypothetical protein